MILLTKMGCIMEQEKELKYEKDLQNFFVIMGILGVGFGVGIALFDLMYDPILSALLSVLFIIAGGVCVMVGGSYFLKRLEAHIAQDDAQQVKKQPTNSTGNASFPESSVTSSSAESFEVNV